MNLKIFLFLSAAPTPSPLAQQTGVPDAQPTSSTLHLGQGRTLTPPANVNSNVRNPAVISSVVAEHKKLFTPNYNKRRDNTRKGKRVKTTTLKFVCLASTRDELPATSVKDRTALCNAGLGDGVVTFNLEGGTDHFDKNIIEKYPKLSEAGGYELMLYQRGKDAAFHTMKPPYTPNRLKEMCGQAKIYIRPLQNNLPLDIISISDGETTHEGTSRKVIIYLLVTHQAYRKEGCYRH